MSSRFIVLAPLAVAFCLLSIPFARAGLVTNTYTTSGSITFPAGVTNVKVEVWGSGGGGGSATRVAATSYAGGGGGGAYARLDAFVVTVGSNYVYSVGAPGMASGGNGNPTFFINSSVLNANGGVGGGNSGDGGRTAGGTGGAVGTTGDAKYKGGDGGSIPASGALTYGGQGGGSAGSSSAGNNGSYNVGPSIETTAVTDGGPGGGCHNLTGGFAPTTGPGGGGGGARKATAGTVPGGAGAAGQIRFTYTVPDLPGTNTTTTVASSSNPSYVGQSVTFTATISPLSGSDTPTGTVQFKTNTVALGSPVTVTAGGGSNGVASITTSDLPAGTHTVTAEYVATGPFNNSSGTLAGGQVVSAVPSTFTWVNAGSGEWNTAANWSPTGPPFNALAKIDNGGMANLTVSALHSPTALRVGVTAGGNGTLNVGANLTVAATANSLIGDDGPGTVNVTAGTLRFAGASLVRFGNAATGAGVLTQSGGTIAASPSVHLGVNGSGSYSLTTGSLIASNNLVAGINAGSVGTVTQSGGSITVGSAIVNSGQTWIGQNGSGVFNFSGGTFTATSMYLGSGAGGSGTVDQTGGTIDLVSGPAGVGVMTVGTGGTGTYSISNGVFSGNNLAVTNGTVNIKPGSTFTLAGALSLGAPAVVNFTFGAAGVSGITAGGTAAVDASAKINLDGSGYTGGPGTFTLIDAASFDGTPVVTLTNFALATTFVWSTNAGEFKVHVGNHAPVAQNLIAGVAIGGSVTVDVIGKYALDIDGDPLTIVSVSPTTNGTVAIVGGASLEYASTNAAAGESFAYTISDGKGGTDTKTVTISTYAAAGYNKLSGPTGTGPYAFSYLGIPNEDYALEESPNLVPPYTWHPVVTNTASATGALNFNGVPLSHPSGSFRTRHVP